MSVSIVLPTYNESGNIVELIEAIQGHLTREGMTHEIVVVDDNSPDGTADLVKQRFSGDPAVRTIIRTEERGLASAIKVGVLNSSFPVILIMDTDFNHDPAMMPQMIKFLEYYDLIIGSRFTMGGGMEDALRYKLSFLYNFALRLTFRWQIQDSLSGFLAIHRKRLEELPLDAIFTGYGDYFIRLLYAAKRRDFRMLEVPVFYQLRRHGQSKTSFLRIFGQYTEAVLRLRLRGLSETAGSQPTSGGGVSSRQS